MLKISKRLSVLPVIVSVLLFPWLLTFKKDVVSNQGNNRTETIGGRTDNRFEILSKESEENTPQNLSITINRDNNSTRSVTQTNDNQKVAV